MVSNRAPGPFGHDTSPTPRSNLLLRLLFLFGLASVCYLLGAAVMFFELPSSGFLSKAFVGARAFFEEEEAASPISDKDLPPVTMGPVDKPNKTFDGYTLCTFASVNIPSTQAFLFNMRGQVVHKWSIPFSQVWPRPPHISEPVEDSQVCFFGCHVYPNGDLLVVFHGLKKVTNGYGLAKLDKDSHVLWKYAGHVHHDVDVGPDGTIYAIQHELVQSMPPGLEFIHTPTLVDSLVLLSPEGELRRKPISLLEALRDSPHADFLDALKSRPKSASPGLTMRHFDEDVKKGDVLHTNFVQVLTRALAPKFPQFKAGQVLISMRHLDALGVLDLDRASFVWARRGPWKAQHDSQFLDNGHLLLFDNLGPAHGSRVLEYDPQTQAIPWSYASEDGVPFSSFERGQCQRLPNGNTLIVDSQGGQFLEVTADKELVWSCSIPKFIHMGRRYSSEQLPFLKGGLRARP
jgi:hypothetical protein